jgi:hypothetical protein
MSLRDPDDVQWKGLELTGDLLEPAVDALMGSGFLHDIPLLGSAMKLAQLSRSVSDRIFLSKIRRFLEGFGGLPPAQAADFAEKLQSDPELAERTGQTLLLSIDSINDLEKAPILALVFGAFLRGEIDLDDFRRLTSAVTLAMVNDLWLLADLESDSAGDADSKLEYFQRLAALHSLRITGLASLSDSAFALVGKRSFISTAVTPLGNVLIRILQPARK